MRGPMSIAGSTLLLCLAACDGGANNAADAAANDGAAAMAASDNWADLDNEGNALAMPAPPPFPGEIGAAAETGPCPFEVRNLRATSGGTESPDGNVEVEVERKSADNREARLAVRRSSSPPILALDLRSSPPVGNIGWTISNFGIAPLPPTFTTVVIYCHGPEIARGPIRRAG